MASSGRLAAALKRVADLANELAGGPANAREVVRELFVAFRDVEREYGRPKPIDEAPRDGDRTLLLYCPEQGGWHAGEWFHGRWVSVIEQTRTLEPTHWLPTPEPPEVDSRTRERPSKEALIKRIRDMVHTGAFETSSEIAASLQHDPEFQQCDAWFTDDLFKAQVDHLCEKMRRSGGK